MSSRTQKCFTLSFDDGICQDIQLVELMNKYGLKGTFNLNTGIQSPDSHFQIEDVEIYRMEQDGLDRLYAGHEIASHGLTHAALTELEDEQLTKEILQDMDNIQKLYGKRPVGFAYAYGAWGQVCKQELARQGILYARTVEDSHQFTVPEDLLVFAPTCHIRDEKLWELAREFVRLPEDKPALFYVWGHSYELEVYKEWDKLEEFFQFISGRDDVFYGDNTRCLQRLGAI